MVGACSLYGTEDRLMQGVVGKPDGMRARCRWEDNINMDLQEVGCGGLDWIEIAQERDRCFVLVNAVMNLQVP